MNYNFNVYLLAIVVNRQHLSAVGGTIWALHDMVFDNQTRSD